MKRMMIIFVLIVLLMSVTTLTMAADVKNNKGEFVGLMGTKSLVEGSYFLTDKLKFEGDFRTYTNASNEGTHNVLRLDLHYQLTDWIGLKVGGRNDFSKEEMIPYGGLDFYAPFGTSNLKLTGFYNYNFEGKEWASYEVALKIEMYPNQFLYAGVRGDGGDGFHAYDFNAQNDPLFFIRGDYNFQWGKFALELQPLLYVTGYIMSDTTLKYSLNDHTNLILDVTDFYDRQIKYRAGIQYKF